MTAVVLATFSGLSYGASDFSGALASKDNDPTVVTVAVQALSLVILSIVLAVSWADPAASDLAWGALAGLGGGVGLASFYRALALGPMSVAAALTAIVSASLPVLAGLALGDRPAVITLVGVGLAVPAGVLVAAGGSTLHGALVDATPRERVAGSRHLRRTRALSVVAGCGFALFFIALSRTSEDAGLTPLASARGASVVALSLMLLLRRSFSPIARTAWVAVVAAGVLDFAANGLYLTALRSGSFTWVAALSSLYPVSTVLLARVMLGERLVPTQVVGLAMAVGAVALVAVGA